MTTMIQNEDAHYDLMERRYEDNLEAKAAAYEEELKNRSESMLDDVMDDAQSFAAFDDSYEVTVDMRSYIWQMLDACDKACNGDVHAIDTVLAALSRMQFRLQHCVEDIVEEQLSGE